MKKKESNINSPYSSKCETISIASGKGGTGKTFIVTCLAYSLQNAGQRVCLIDTDFATQGLSLFILGRGAERGISKLIEENSLYHMVQNWNKSSGKLPTPKEADRSYDHGISYKIILSNKQFYDRSLSLGVKQEAKIARSILNESMGETSNQFRNNYRLLIRSLIQNLAESDNYDYILIDTRGGFGELSLTSVVFSDSFLIVTEPDFTSFHQLAKLLTNVDLMAKQEKTRPYIRGIIVNKAIDGEEEKFRSQLESQFGIEFGLSWPIPLDQDAIKIYKNQLIPYESLPGSIFSYTSLNAFNDIFDIVTAEWTRERKNKWNDLLKNVETAKREQKKKIKAKENEILIRQKQTDEEIKKAKYTEEVLQMKLESSEIRIKEEKEQYKKAEKEINDLRNEIKTAELGVIKKSSIRTVILFIFITLFALSATVSVFFYFDKANLKRALNEMRAEAKELQYRLFANEQQMISISIETIPSKAVVYIDEKAIGMTPLTTNVREGSHQLTIRREGYLTQREIFYAKPGQDLRKTFKLRLGVEK